MARKVQSVATRAARRTITGRKVGLKFKSIADLMTGVRRIGNSEDKNKRNKVRLETVAYNAHMGQVNINGTCKPLTDLEAKAKGVVYKVSVTLGRIGASDKKETTHPLKLGDKYLERATVLKTPIRVRCSCKRFHYAWMYWDKRKSALKGIDKAGAPTADAARRVNQVETEGMCKHVLEMITTLRKRGIIA